MIARNDGVVLSLFLLAAWLFFGEPMVQAAEPAKRLREVVHLDKTRQWQLKDATLDEQGMLAHQIIRQALLITSRDELGLLARDAWLGDAMPREGDNPPLNVVACAKEEQSSGVRMVEGFAPRHDEGLTEREIAQQPIDMRGDYLKLCVDMESLSRNGFVDVLKKVGFQGKPNRQVREAIPSPGTEKRLGEMTFTSQFEAIRRLHGQIRAEGESDALLGALVRGYANLGVLTETQWHPAHKVFKARAMLYAQRMVARNDASAWAKYHRAYALALTGLHQQAMDDLDAAEKITAETRPPWAELIRAYCRYDIKPLDPTAVEKPWAELTRLLRYLVVEQGNVHGYNTRVVETALESLEAMPECYRIHDALVEDPPVGIGHSATMMNLKTMGERVYSRLGDMLDLPEAIRNLIRPANAGLAARLFGAETLGMDEEFALRGDLMAAMLGVRRVGKEPNVAPPLAETDMGEPSWATLGLLIREETFLQVVGRAGFERYLWSVSADEFLAMAAPLFADHPYRAYIETHAYRDGDRSKAVERLARLEPEGLDFNGLDMCYCVDEASNKLCVKWIKQGHAMLDNVASDLTAKIRWETKISPVPKSKLLLSISPFSPYARARLVEHDWGAYLIRAATWEEESAGHPVVLRALAKKYAEDKHYDDTIRCYNKAIAISPDKATYEALAAVYREQGNEPMWLATLEEHLKTPDYGLAHARIRSNIAQHFISKRQWAKALPYALGAAECGSDWGLYSAADCHEGMRNWQLAEGVLREIAERYDSSRLAWYFFCRRTGQGDLAAARALAREYLTNPDTDRRQLEWFSVGDFYLLEGDGETALKHFERCYQKTNDPYEGFRIALVADQLKETQRRDAALQQIQQKGTDFIVYSTNKPREHLLALADMILDDLDAGGRGEIDLAGADKLASAIEDDLARMNFHYYLAKYLDLHGKPDAAIHYWKLCLAHTGVTDWCRTLAGAELIARGYAPDCYLTVLADQGAEDRPAEQPEPQPEDTKPAQEDAVGSSE